MNESELKQALQSGKAKPLEPQIKENPQPPQDTSPQAISEFSIVLSALRRVRKNLTSAPTLTPKNFLDQIQFYDDGSSRRVYFYVNNTWRYVTLT